MITSKFLNNVAEFVDSNISKVVLNKGEYEITDFLVKSASDNIVTLNYIVPNGSVAAINSIELKDSSNNGISDNTVYVPIHADTMMIQTIQVKEGI
ncbi:ketopantoate hydroxymethyltransferase [Alkaliphilus peptidifermentans]|uniref:Ketopantoate hydroxymethyltransferase n=1 Tax=Alkaliphilus peptidifermentans DSM 18978 TaxID=1120976 RepID=A0A1G5JXU6_9FIRM|nr:ketopantoate hydroxymethyltransferase [Alkaliphilus peptidifermentans]SCY93137.1 hypothetical protein SAMN03080606_03107 [Alkaliphilus peptidifermentans DSM 18978]